jgi:hypothetical protein
MGTAGKLQAINEQEEWLIGLPSQVDHNIKCLGFKVLRLFIETGFTVT